jgi:hypothetical protein
MRASLCAAFVAVVVLTATGCFVEYEGYAPRPTLCNPVGPGGEPSREYRACAVGEACIFADASGNYAATHTACYPAVDPSSATGQACDALNGCRQGQACTDVGCMELCYVGETCADGSACEGDPSGEPSVAGRAVGTCARTP